MYRVLLDVYKPLSQATFARPRIMGRLCLGFSAPNRRARSNSSTVAMDTSGHQCRSSDTISSHLIPLICGQCLAYALAEGTRSDAIHLHSIHPPIQQLTGTAHEPSCCGRKIGPYLLDVFPRWTDITAYPCTKNVMTGDTAGNENQAGARLPGPSMCAPCD